MKPYFFALTKFYHSIYCDQACENRACGHMIFAYFFNLSELISFYQNIQWQWNFQHLIQLYLALWCRLQNKNILFQYWDMTFRVTGCSLCPHALFLQARSHYIETYQNWLWVLVSYNISHRLLQYILSLTTLTIVLGLLPLYL